MSITGLRTVSKKVGGADVIMPGFPLYALAYSRFGYALLHLGKSAKSRTTLESREEPSLKA